jgi:hypothetical protein
MSEHSDDDLCKAGTCFSQLQNKNPIVAQCSRSINTQDGASSHFNFENLNFWISIIVEFGYKHRRLNHDYVQNCHGREHDEFCSC